MTMQIRFAGFAAVLGLGLATLAAPAARAEDIVVTHYGAGMYGIPYSIALEKGWFKAAGVEVGGILTSKGGGTSVRNLMAGDTLYAEVAVAAALAAIKEGYKIKLLNSGTIGRNGFWVTRHNAAIDGPADLKGKRIGFTRPKSSTENQAMAFLSQHKVPVSEVTMTAAGDIAAGITALVSNRLDIVLATEPAYSTAVRNGLQFKPLLWLDKDVPAPTQTVGIATDEVIAKRPDKLRALIAVRQRAVRFIYDNMEESAKLAAKDMQIDPGLLLDMMRNVRRISDRWWSEGGFDIPSLNVVAEEMAGYGQIALPVDWPKIMDRRFLPAALHN
ncbi:MAG: ABC transporter substrate-binding protein [Alphaproteobacteria bacterium]|nr:ABC transporter substrate-binding protein [Alphaproteobacteria bacterium]